MSEVLGKMEKPLAEDFKAGRKLYLVPLVFSGKGAPQDYLEKFNKYWDQAEEQVANLERKIGKINKVYHESISFTDDYGMRVIKELNERSYQIVKNKCEHGAQLQATEDINLFTESMDWGNCLRVVVGEKVFQKVSGFYNEVTQKRYEYIAKIIDETLKDGEAGILFIREDHRVQFPSTIQVFYIAPPALDDLHRWLREQEFSQEKAKKPQAESSKGNEEKKT